VTIADAQGNTWVSLGSFAHSAGNARIYAWLCNVTTQIGTGDNVTVSFTNSINDSSIALWEYSVDTGNTLEESASPLTSEVTAASGFGSSSFAGLASKQRLYLRVGAKRANATTAITATTNFTTHALAIRSRNSTNDAIMQRAEHRINTSTGETSNPTLATTGNTASLFIALEEATPPPETVDVSQSFTGVHSAALGLVVTLGLAFASTSVSELESVKSTERTFDHASASTLELEVTPTILVDAYSNVLVVEATTEGNTVDAEFTGTHTAEFSRSIETTRSFEHESVSSQELVATPQTLVDVYSNVLVVEATTSAEPTLFEVAGVHASDLDIRVTYPEAFSSTSVVGFTRDVARVRNVGVDSTSALGFSRVASHQRGLESTSVSEPGVETTEARVRSYEHESVSTLGFTRSVSRIKAYAHGSSSTPEYARTLSLIRDIGVTSQHATDTSVVTSGSQEHDVTSVSTATFTRVASLTRSFEVSSVSEFELGAVAGLAINLEHQSASALGLARTYSFTRSYSHSATHTSSVVRQASRSRSQEFASTSTPSVALIKHRVRNYSVESQSQLNTWHGVPGEADIDVYSNVLVITASTLADVAGTDVYSNVLVTEATTLPSFGVVSSGPYLHNTFVVLEVVGLDGPYTMRWSPSNTTPNAPGSVALTIQSDSLDGNGDGIVTIIGDRGIVRYLETGYIWTTLGGTSIPFATTLQLEGGKQAVTLTSPLAAPEFRLTAIPDLEPGDQVIWWDVVPSGDVVVLSDGSFNATLDVAFFDVEAHIPGLGYTATAVQDLTAGFVLSLNVASTHSVGFTRGVSAALSFSYESTSVPELEVNASPSISRSFDHTGTLGLDTTVVKALSVSGGHSLDTDLSTLAARAREFTGNHSTVILDFTVSTPGLSTVNESFVGSHVVGLQMVKSVTVSRTVPSIHAVGSSMVKNVTLLISFSSSSPVGATLDPTNLVPRITATSPLQHNTQGVIVGENFGD
jgi:hypothetical protein